MLLEGVKTTSLSEKGSELSKVIQRHILSLLVSDLAKGLASGFYVSDNMGTSHSSQEVVGALPVPAECQATTDTGMDLCRNLEALLHD